MAETVVLATKPRTDYGSRAAKRLREKEKRVPAVIYGHKQATLAVSVPLEDVERAIRSGSHVVDIQADGGTEKALIQEVQWDYLGKDVLHVDFLRVSEDERVTVPVKIELRGIAPGTGGGGGVLDQPLHTLTVECPAIRIPDSIRVNIGALQLGGAIHVRDLTLPPDVKVLDDPDAIVVHVTSKAMEPEAAPPVVATGAEPEVIGRAPEEGEEEK
jgi:large subunit ribosomal protein L25